MQASLKVGNEGLNVVLVDNKNYFRQGMRDMLANEFGGEINEIAEASNGRDFLNLISEFPANLVFIEPELPDINGFEATLEATKLFPNLKIYALSAHDEPAYVKEMFNSGAEGFLSKNEDVLERIRIIVKGFYSHTRETTTFTDALLNGLLFGCPLNEHITECPIASIWAEPLIARVNNMKRRSKLEKIDLYTRHKECLFKREHQQ